MDLYQQQTKTSKSLSATGGIFAFLVGMWIGVVANQRYQLPRSPFWGDGESRERRHCRGGDGGDGDGSSRHSRWREEFREGLEKIKAMERRYRKEEGAGQETSAHAQKAPWDSSAAAESEKSSSPRPASWGNEWSE